MRIFSFALILGSSIAVSGCGGLFSSSNSNDNNWAPFGRGLENRTMILRTFAPADRGGQEISTSCTMTIDGQISHTGTTPFRVTFPIDPRGRGPFNNTFDCVGEGFTPVVKYYREVDGISAPTIGLGAQPVAVEIADDAQEIIDSSSEAAN